MAFHTAARLTPSVRLMAAPDRYSPGCASSRDRTVSRLKAGPSFKSAIRTCGLYYTRGGWVVSTEAGRQA